MGRRFDPDRAHHRLAIFRRESNLRMQHFIWVDLDRTLIKQDSTWTCLRGFRKDSGLFQLILLVLQCRFHRFEFKSKLCERVALESLKWNFDENLISELKLHHRKGAKIHLITGATETAARFFGKTLPFVSEIYFSSKDLKMKGLAKYHLMQKNSYGSLDYYGDSRHDLQIWNAIGRAHFSKSNLKVYLYYKFLRKSVEINRY